ncbi:glyoxalase/bleomycin resistance/dioxygenase family protein [Kiloniella laminariae]|uniref:glyoxalase/bleomycin resistance/dioxygenase family protein n=1 Tax=Kiloniella laminariae TaxID=454162 RepID=UPI000372EEDD|nr:glyoxalase/bleomycin resistance/dioxygenase family protein [Kiloniella laminariae]
MSLTSQPRPVFTPGTNVAMKIPSHLFDQMVAFYEDTLGLPANHGKSSVTIDFGAIKLWLDKVPGMSQPELWLQVTAPDTPAAARYFEEQGIVRCDEIEQLPEELGSFWIAAPGGVIR